mmetsp:Transcript_10194/g.21378  ORF Transcript_10194/g.21378 Transcript_10194/m.21378 type:complete len:200 (-) Transcript_10194:2303-2902(-)
MLEVICLSTITGLRGRNLDYPHAIIRGHRMGVTHVMCDTIVSPSTNTITIIHQLCIILNHQFQHAHRHLRFYHHQLVGLCLQVDTRFHLVIFIRHLPHQSRESHGLPGAATEIIRYTRHITHLNHNIRHILLSIDPKDRQVGRPDRIHHTTMTIVMTLINLITTKVVEVCLYHLLVEREGQKKLGFHLNCISLLVRIDQ